MTDRPGHRLGSGPLTISRVLSDAAGMFRLGRRRVAAVALILFGFPALLTAIVESAAENLAPSPGVAPVVLLVGTILIAATLRLFGPVMFSGFLDAAVGREYLFGNRSSFREVLRSLPWFRLLAADLIVTTATGFGLALLLVPGIAFYLLFGLVGPVIVQERHGLLAGFRRTMSLSRRALPQVAVLVLLPAIFEIVLDEILIDLAHGASFGIQVLVEWLVAALVGGSIGLVEVALAAELMARYPLLDGSAIEERLGSAASG